MKNTKSRLWKSRDGSCPSVTKKCGNQGKRYKKNNLSYVIALLRVTFRWSGTIHQITTYLGSMRPLPAHLTCFMDLWQALAAREAIMSSSARWMSGDSGKLCSWLPPKGFWSQGFSSGINMEKASPLILIQILQGTGHHMWPLITGQSFWGEGQTPWPNNDRSGPHILFKKDLKISRHRRETGNG